MGIQTRCQVPSLSVNHYQVDGAIMNDYVRVPEPLLWRVDNVLPATPVKGKAGRRMVLCQVCHTIQKAGDTCSNCKAPVAVPEVN